MDDDYPYFEGDYGEDEYGEDEYGPVDDDYNYNDVAYSQIEQLSNQQLGTDFGINLEGKAIKNFSPIQIFNNNLTKTFSELNIKQNSFLKTLKLDYSINEVSDKVSRSLPPTFLDNINAARVNYPCLAIALAIKNNQNALAKFKKLCEQDKFGSTATLFTMDNVHVKCVDIYRYYRLLK